MPEPPASERPRVVVFSSLFPSAVQPHAGLFVRERMFRVGQHMPISVVAPTPWFPLQRLLRRWKAGFRPGAPAHEVQQGVDVWFPRYLSVPGVLKGLDGLLMALGAWPRLRRLKREGRLDIIDAHFAYPEGYAATLLGRWLGVPVTITLRGTEVRHARDGALAGKVRAALQRSSRLFAVSESLRRVAMQLGTEAERVRVIGNGVDLDKFVPVPRAEARRRLDLPATARVLVTVGALVERKGFHRVIELLPALRQRFPDLIYLVVGGPSPEGDLSEALRRQTREAGLESAVRFLGPMSPADLHLPLSAADVFVLASRNEGWANVLLEAMACGLPVVATDVGGNAEVVSAAELGRVVPFGDPGALTQALDAALRSAWDAQALRRHAADNAWDRRVATLCEEFEALHGRSRSEPASGVRHRPDNRLAMDEEADHA